MKAAPEVALAAKQEARSRPPLGRAAAIDHSLIVFPVLVTVWLFTRYLSAHQIAVDFNHDFWVAGLRVLHGQNPYLWTRQQTVAGFGFPYPAAAAMFFVPFSLIPVGVAGLLFIGVSLAACLGALWLLNVRDWRLYTFVLLWWPVINAWQTGNLTLLLVLGVAATWRYRDSPLATGLVVGLMVSLKPIVWPLAIWLVLSRRYRALLYAGAVAAGLNAIAWSVIGFGQARDWLHLMATQMNLLYTHGYALVALAARFGAGRNVGTVLQVLVTGILVIGCFACWRRHRDRELFTLAVVLIVVASPRVDNHYFALFIVPLAIARPRLSRAWLIPLVFWLCPATGFAAWQVGVAWATIAGLSWCLWRAGEMHETGNDSVRAPLLIHHSEILSLKGDSYRLRGKELDARPAARLPEIG